MLITHDESSARIKAVIDLINIYFPHMQVCIIGDVGSRSKGEANYLSDYDLQITVKSNYGIVRDSRDSNSDIFEADDEVIDSQVAALCGVPIIDIDHANVDRLSRQLEQQSAVNAGFVFVDIRTLLLNLAFETPMSAFRTHWFTLTSKTLYDRWDLMPSLQRCLIHQRSFHWYPTIDLQITRYLKHRKLKTLFYELEKGDQPGSDKNEIVYKWLIWALNYVRFAVGTWSLVSNGYYTFRRDDVLRFIAANLPAKFFSLACDLYKFKGDPKRRPVLHQTLLNDEGQPSQEMWRWMQKLNSLFIFTSEATLNMRPDIEIDRRRDNALAIIELFSQKFELPDICVDTWIADSNEKVRNVLSSMAKE